MEFRRHHFYIVLGLLIFGGLIELSKFDSTRLHSDRRLRIAMNNLEEKPYTRPANDDETLPETERRFAPPTMMKEAAHFPENNTFSHPPPSGERGVVTAAKKDDDKSKKEKDKDKDKKKKKKKDPSVALPPPTPLQAARELPPQIKKPQTPDSALIPGPATAPSPKADIGGFGGGDNSHTNTAQEWERKLLNQPDSAATSNFVRLFKSGSVTADVFYSVVGKMIADPREAMKLLGVSAAGQVQNYQSFNLLATAAGANASSSQTAQAAQAQLNKYAKMAYQSVLETVLRTAGPAQADVIATNLIGQIATQLSATLHGSSGGGTGGGGSGGGRSAAAYAPTFNRLADLIKRISTAPGATGQLASAANTTLTAISSLLGS